MITELLLGGNMNNMTPEILVALCSCFVIDEGKKEDNDLLEKEIQFVLDSLKAITSGVTTVKKEAGIISDIGD